MQKYFIVLVLYSLLISCTQQNNNSTTKKTITMVQKDSTKKEIIYGISVSIDTPFELYVNDIAIAKEYSKARKMMGIELNKYILKNGTYKVKIKLLPVKRNDTLLVSPKDVANSHIKFIQFEVQREPKMGRSKNYKEIQKLPLPKIEEPVPFLEAEWEIEITDLPYELEGWSNSQDLRKIDKEVLKKEVVGFYNHLRDLLHTGKVDEYMQLLNTYYKDVDIFDYINKNKSKKDAVEIKQELLNEAKGNMQPIENYKLFIYANGKLVTLERINNDDMGESALRTLEPDGTEYWYKIVLHKPKGSKTFEIIR